MTTSDTVPYVIEFRDTLTLCKDEDTLTRSVLKHVEEGMTPFRVLTQVQWAIENEAKPREGWSPLLY